MIKNISYGQMEKVTNSKELIIKYIKSLKHNQNSKLFIVEFDNSIFPLITDNISEDYKVLKVYTCKDFCDINSIEYYNKQSILQKIIVFGINNPNIIRKILK